MFSEEYNKIPLADQTQFAHVVNKLLLKGFVVREVYDSKEKSIKTNPDYKFIERYFELIESYLDYTGWTIEQDSLLGVVALINTYQENRMRIDRETSLLTFALRLIYENEKSEGSQLGQSIYLTTPVLISFMLEHGIVMPGKKLSGRSVSRSLRFLANHNIISKVSGSFDEGNVSFYLLPSITYALDNDKIIEMSKAIDELNNRVNPTGGDSNENLN